MAVQGVKLYALRGQMGAAGSRRVGGAGRRPGSATQDSPGGEQRALERPVFLDGTGTVVAAAGREATTHPKRRHERRQRCLVDVNGTQQQLRRKLIGRSTRPVEGEQSQKGEYPAAAPAAPRGRLGDRNQRWRRHHGRVCVTKRTIQTASSNAASAASVRLSARRLTHSFPRQTRSPQASQAKRN